MLQLIKSLVPMATKSGSRIEILQQFCFCHPTLRQCPSTTTIQAMMLKQYLPIISIQAAHLCSTLHLFLYTIMNSISGPHLCPTVHLFAYYIVHKGKCHHISHFLAHTSILHFIRCYPLTYQNKYISGIYALEPY